MRSSKFFKGTTIRSGIACAIFFLGITLSGCAKTRTAGRLQSPPLPSEQATALIEFTGDSDVRLASAQEVIFDEPHRPQMSTSSQVEPIPFSGVTPFIAPEDTVELRLTSAQEELIDELPPPKEPPRLNVDELRRKLFGDAANDSDEADEFLDDSDEASNEDAQSEMEKDSDRDSDSGSEEDGGNENEDKDDENGANDEEASRKRFDADQADELTDQQTSSLLDRKCIDTNPLMLSEVLDSASQSYPLIEVAMAELAAAEGKTLASWGSFDSVLSAYSLNKPIGFFETFRHGAKYSRPLWNGGEVYSGYKIGRGQFEPWYQERQTNEGGQFSTGIKQPLMKGYAIDGRRVALQTAQLERRRLEPDIQSRMIGMQLAASQVYWKWVASGQVVRTQEQLVELAKQRNKNLIARVKEGDLPKITEIDNGRFIAKRQVKLNESQRKVREAAIKLSLFYRDEAGQPFLVEDDRLPCNFPVPEPVNPEAVEADINLALSTRPELLDLDFQQRQVELELGYAQNKTLPKLDAYAEASQDVGEESTSSRNKSPFEFEVGFLAEVPIQR